MRWLHQLRETQITIFMRHFIKGYQRWVVDSAAVASGSAGASVEGRHYCRNMRINKEIFCSLIQFRAKNITNDDQDLAHKLKKELILLGVGNHHQKIFRMS